MKKNFLYYAMALALTTFAVVGCQQFDDVPPFAPATEQQLLDEGYTIMDINTFKQQYFYDKTPTPSSSVVSYTIEDKVALKTKVISSDEQGNIYRSLYVQDAKGAEFGGIEIKVGKGSLYTTYKVGQVVYIKADGLELGNYRWCLSLGGKSSDEKYSNGYIDIQTTIDQKLLPGEIVGLNSADTLVVNNGNVAEIIANDKLYLGTLVRLEDIKSHWGTVSGNDYYSSSDKFPSFLENIDGAYTTYVYSEYKEDPNYPNGLPATWAYYYNNNYYYGSALFLYSDAYPFIIRSSAYSRFALNEIPAHGEVVDITAILQKYCSSSGGFMKYQLLLNTDEDVVVK